MDANGGRTGRDGDVLLLWELREGGRETRTSFGAPDVSILLESAEEDPLESTRLLGEAFLTLEDEGVAKLCSNGLGSRSWLCFDTGSLRLGRTAGGGGD